MCFVLTVVQESDRTAISVSKLCCPVCWELLAILRGDSQEFAVRGHHHTFYETDLHVSLPDNIIRRMVQRFELYLRRELESIMAKADKALEIRVPDSEPLPETKHHRNLSQSTAGLSGGTKRSNPRDPASSYRSAWKSRPLKEDRKPYVQ
jgi:hypothetical protein